MLLYMLSICSGVTPPADLYFGNLSFLDGYHCCPAPHVLYQGSYSFLFTVSFGLHIFLWSKSIGVKSGSFFCHLVVSIKISTKTNGGFYPVANGTFITVSQLSHLDLYRSCPHRICLVAIRCVSIYSTPEYISMLVLVPVQRVVDLVQWESYGDPVKISSISSGKLFPLFL
jgi:hypothetical protein